MTAGMTWGFAIGCSDPVPGETGGAAGNAGAGGTGTSGSNGAGGAVDAGGDSGGAGGASADAGPTAEEACEHLARVSCQKYVDCLPWYVPANFGNFDTCMEQYIKTQCRNRIGIEDSSDTPALRQACAAARSAATCAEWSDNALAVSACLLLEPGRRATGAACGTAQQCQTIKCDIAPDAECGTCGGPLVGAGAPCMTGNDCESNLECFDGVCGLRRGLGEPCSSLAACRYEFACVDGRCAVPAKAGESCISKPCNSRAGLFCRMSSGVCEPFEFVETGEACDLFEGPFCRGGVCKTDVSPKGICAAMVREGEACNDAGGPYCMNWASCVKGVCKIPQPAACN
jgi:hypothetical protein